MEEIQFQHHPSTKPATSPRVKLFGFHVDSSSSDADLLTEEPDRSSTKSSTSSPDPPLYTNSSQATTLDDSGRKYECQYCYREFANSQALGGHQNAHKKERQQHKRAQLRASRNAAARNPMISAFARPSHLFGSASPMVVPASAVHPPQLASSASWVYMPRALQPLHVSHGCVFSAAGAGGLAYAGGAPDLRPATASYHHFQMQQEQQQQQHQNQHQRVEASSTGVGPGGPTSLSRFSDGPSFDDSVGLDLHLSLAPSGS